MSQTNDCIRHALGYSWLTTNDIIRISGADVRPSKVWKVFQTDIKYGIVETEIVTQNGHPVRIWRRKQKGCEVP